MSVIAFDGNQKANKFTCTRHTRLWRKWATIMMIDAISTVSCWTKSLLDDHNILMRQPLFHTKFKIINLFHFRLTFLVWHRFVIQNWCTRDEGRDDENNARGCLKINHAVVRFLSVDILTHPFRITSHFFPCTFTLRSQTDNIYWSPTYSIVRIHQQSRAHAIFHANVELFQ